MIRRILFDFYFLWFDKKNSLIFDIIFVVKETTAGRNGEIQLKKEGTKYSKKKLSRISRNNRSVNVQGITCVSLEIYNLWVSYDEIKTK